MSMRQISLVRDGRDAYHPIKPHSSNSKPEMHTTNTEVQVQSLNEAHSLPSWPYATGT